MSYCINKSFLLMIAVLSAADATAASAEQQFEEILVTVRKIVEKAQDVLVALAALSAEQIAIYDIRRAAPQAG